MLKFELPLGAVASGTSDFVAPRVGREHSVIDLTIDCSAYLLPILEKTYCNYTDRIQSFNPQTRSTLHQLLLKSIILTLLSWILIKDWDHKSYLSTNRWSSNLLSISIECINPLYKSSIQKRRTPWNPIQREEDLDLINQYSLLSRDKKYRGTQWVPCNLTTTLIRSSWSMVANKTRRGTSRWKLIGRRPWRSAARRVRGKREKEKGKERQRKGEIEGLAGGWRAKLVWGLGVKTR